MGGVGVLVIGLVEDNRNFRLCGHLYNISLLWFKLVSFLARRMLTFSVMQRSHRCPPLENEWALALMDHLICGFLFAFLHFQM